MILIEIYDNCNKKSIYLAEVENDILIKIEIDDSNEWNL